MKSLYIDQNPRHTRKTRNRKGLYLGSLTDKVEKLDTLLFSNKIV